MNYTENVIVPERTLLVSLDTGEYDAEESLRELWELAKSGGAEPYCDDDAEAPLPGDCDVRRQRHGGGNSEFLREQRD